jgi:adenylate cyclase
MTHTHDVWFQWTTSPDRSASDSLRMAQRGVALDAQSSSGHVALAGAYSLIADRDRTIAAAERAIQLNPSSAQALSALGAAQGISGRPEEAIRNLVKAQRLSPRDPRMWSFLDGLAHAHFAAGRYEEAGNFAQQVLQQKPDYSFGHFLIAATRAHQGRLDEARTALAAGLRLQPEFSQAAADRMFGWGDPSFLEPYLDGLRKAGLKE